MRISPLLCDEIGKRLSSVPAQWDGKDAILEMKNNNYPHWRQMEWIGFYFQYLCEQRLADIFQLQTPRCGNASFDGLYQVPFDFKSHAINTSSHHLIVNDSEAIAWAIKEYGCVGVIIALGTVVYNDEERTFQHWHETLKGGVSAYTEERIARGAWSRLRKCELSLKQVSIVEITDETLVQCGSFQQDFRNADGGPRRKKVLVDLEKIDDALVYCIEYQ